MTQQKGDSDMCVFSPFGEHVEAPYSQVGAMVPNPPPEARKKLTVEAVYPAPKWVKITGSCGEIRTLSWREALELHDQLSRIIAEAMGKGA